MIDLTNLTPAPWFNLSFGTKGDFGLFYGDPKDASEIFDLIESNKPGDMEFIALARNAFDIMLRRGWHAQKTEEGTLWVVLQSQPSYFPLELFQDWTDHAYHSDPFTALVEADRWYREHVETPKP
jgi:hypothetical protein